MKIDRERSFNLLRTAVSLLIALAVAYIIIFAVSATPLESIQIFTFGPLDSARHMGNIVEMAIPLIFSGLSMAVVFQASLFNLGAEGIFFLTGALVSVVAIFVPMPAGVHPLVIISMGALIGALVMLIPGILKAKFNASELVTSLMLNSILLGVGLYILTNFLRDPTTGTQISYKFAKTALLPDIIPGTRIHLGLVFALVCVVVTFLFLYRTKWGYEIRMTGLNADFARYSGINTAKVIIMAHVVAGILAGMGGAVETIGMHQRFEWTALPGYGFDGAMIAMLAGNNPLGVVGAALFVAYLRVGADMVARLSDVPTEMVAILQCIIILLVSAERFLHKYKQRWIEKGVVKHGATV
ncbi:MAG: ABC transporter permease [Pseudoflavonifractor sp.]